MNKEKEQFDSPSPALIHVSMGHAVIEECRSISFIYFRNAKYPDGALAYAGSIWPEDMAHEEIFYRSKAADHLSLPSEIEGGGVLTLYRDPREGSKTLLTGVISKDSHTYPGHVEREIIRKLWNNITEKFNSEAFEFDAPFLK